MELQIGEIRPRLEIVCCELRYHPDLLLSTVDEMAASSTRLFAEL
jgi:hypothetical protein